MSHYALGEGGGTKILVAQHKKNHLFFCVFPNLLLSNSYIFDTNANMIKTILVYIFEHGRFTKVNAL